MFHKYRENVTQIVVRRLKQRDKNWFFVENRTIDQYSSQRDSRFDDYDDQRDYNDYQAKFDKQQFQNRNETYQINQ